MYIYRYTPEDIEFTIKTYVPKIDIDKCLIDISAAIKYAHQQLVSLTNISTYDRFKHR